MEASLRGSTDTWAASGSGAGGGYSRRCQPGDPKTNDRRRLLTDRNAYISHLESHIERVNATALELESTSSGMRQLRLRMDELEDRVRSTGRSVELVQAQSNQTSDGAKEWRNEAQDQLNRLEARTVRLEKSIAEGRAAAEAEMARLRNEFSLAVQELGQRMDERAHKLEERVSAVKERFDDRLSAFQAITDDGTSMVIREAQATCVRLADDALGAAEGSQKKVDELARQAASSQRRLEDLVSQTEAGLEALRADVVGVRAEMAGSAAAAAVNGVQEMRTSPLQGPCAPDAASQALAETVERRLASRLGQQVLQLGEVLRRVVQSQAALNQQFSGKAKSRKSSATRNMFTPEEALVVPPDNFSDTTSLTSLLPSGAAHDSRRRLAVDELYRELRYLESGGSSRRSKR
eukprot:TRINITY_DN44140_c0_g1_i1.p1 TRINITY_DN44140_c0_g1~~TRINITY_DN44140_c0_g1_i1.p1  ORF type:complete len:407 (+),score=83.62 TRINITY_DN44140_c0_g1_i1:11-1231(+)